jgi:hypothetical protein
MKRKTELSEDNYNSFYKTIIFGDYNDDPIKASIKTAYRDLCRTINGFSKNENHNKIYNEAVNLLHKEISENLKNINNSDDFDDWHRECCKNLINEFEDRNQHFYYGQAQKWINMSLKYLSMLDHKLVEKQYEFFHVPIDNIMIKATNIKTPCSWSKITRYDEYKDWQENFRKECFEKECFEKECPRKECSRKECDMIPLDKEFYLWLGERKK